MAAASNEGGLDNGLLFRRQEYIVKNVEILADTIRKAFHIARSGRPGPVLIDITKDVTAATCEYTPVTIQPEERVTRYTREELMLVAEMIHKAKKPYIYLGGGAIISGASAEVAEFAELIDAPVCDTLMGKGAFDGRSERYTGMIGMHGTKTSNLGVSECDLLVALGARFSDRVTGNPKKFAENARIIQLDVDAAEINKNIRVDASLVGDLKKTLTELNACLSKQEHPEWMAHITELKEKYPLKYDDENLSCPYIIRDLPCNNETIITSDVDCMVLIFFLQFRYMCHPLGMFLFRQAGIQFGQSLLQISYQRCIHTDILVDLRSIHIQLDDSCVLRELLRVTRHTV